MEDYIVWYNYWEDRWANFADKGIYVRIPNLTQGMLPFASPGVFSGLFVETPGCVSANALSVTANTSTELVCVSAFNTSPHEDFLHGITVISQSPEYAEYLSNQGGIANTDSTDPINSTETMSAVDQPVVTGENQLVVQDTNQVIVREDKRFVRELWEGPLVLPRLRDTALLVPPMQGVIVAPGATFSNDGEIWQAAQEVWDSNIDGASTKRAYTE